MVPHLPLLREASCQVRVVDEENFPHMVVVDGRSAVIHSAPAAHIEHHHSVQALEMLFAANWAAAHPIDRYLRIHEHLHHAPAQRVLDGLCTGNTDAIAARELQMSLRTYRRHATALIDALGVRTRFQAGARVAGMSLLQIYSHAVFGPPFLSGQRRPATIDIVLGDIALVDAQYIPAARAAYHRMTLRSDTAVRLVCSPAVFEIGRIPREFLRHHSQVKIAKIPKSCAMVTDGNVAVIAGSPLGQPRFSETGDKASMTAFAALFENVWSCGVSAHDRVAFEGSQHVVGACQILDSLRIGLGDESAARELCVSVRTYRRYVAEALVVLKARSRFQAGVKATQLGYLPVVQAPDPR
ncbi:MAG: hypothetical protein ACRCSP_07205 [Rhodoglobus sp.]